MLGSGEFTENLQRVAVQFPPFVMAVIFHEWAHGRAALWWGDKTAQEQGRLTLNPIPHLDPIGTVAFPLINMITGIPLLIGWAKPVPIDPKRFRKFRPGLFWVAFAGPMMNFSLAVFSAFLAFAVMLWVPESFYLHEPLKIMAAASVSVNFALGIFNLLPLPPLDGSKMIESFLSYPAMQKYQELSRFSMFIFLALLLTGAINILAVPIRFLTDLTFGTVGGLFSLLGL
jgi:Zn-dependent protease